jgi:hypothetical protein
MPRELLSAAPTAGAPRAREGRFRLPRSIARIAVATWFGAMLLLGAALLAKHVVALPVPEKDARLARSVATLRVPAAQGKWLAVHVLYAECRCSQRVVAHLISTARPKDWDETVLWVGKATPDPALSEHYHVKKITSTELARLGIEAAPLLVVLDPQDHLHYAGGYTTRKQGPVIDDLRILDAAQHPGPLESLPVFGCAVSDRLKQELSILPGL